MTFRCRATTIFFFFTEVHLFYSSTIDCCSNCCKLQWIIFRWLCVIQVDISQYFVYNRNMCNKVQNRRNSIFFPSENGTFIKIAIWISFSMTNNSRKKKLSKFSSIFQNRNVYSRNISTSCIRQPSRRISPSLYCETSLFLRRNSLGYT